MEPPKLHDRALGDLIAEGEVLANQYCAAEAPAWTGFTDANDPGRALIVLGARLVEVLAERVNRVPEKNLLAFLDLVGVERAPGMPAEAPVTFLLSARSEAGQQVPAGIQVATTQSEGADAQVFETRTAFFATPAQLVHTVSLVAAADLFGSLAPLALPPKPEALTDTAGTMPIMSGQACGLQQVEHALYVASPALFARKEQTDVVLEFMVTNGNHAVFDDRFLVWQRFDDERKAWIDIRNVTYSLAGSDRVSVMISAFPGTAKSDVFRDNDAWIVARLRTAPRQAPALPIVGNLQGFITTPQPPVIAADAAAVNDTAVDLSKPVFPFGERPRYGDAFHIVSDRGFAPDVGNATIHFTIRPYTVADLQGIFATILEDTTITTKIEWQYLAASGEWKTIRTVSHNLAVTKGNPPTFQQRGATQQPATNDEKNATLFGTIGEASPIIDFTFSPAADAAAGKVGGVTGHWVRAVLRSQNPYGRDGFVKITNNVPQAVDPTFIPPVIEKIAIEYNLTTSAIEVDRITAANNFEFRKLDKPFFVSGSGFAPFVPLEDYAPFATPGFLGDGPALYLSFDRKFGNAFISLFVALREPRDAAHLAPETGNPHIVWEYLAESLSWKPLDIQDGTTDLTSSGIIAFQAPPDSGAQILFPLLTNGAPLYWYRARLQSGTYATPPQLRAVVLNSVMADNHETIGRDWVLASGSGEPNQTVTILRRPMLAGEIWVRENEVPSDAERQELVAELTERAIEEGAPSLPSEADVLDLRPAVAAADERQVWVLWLRVPNFESSGPRSRHYTLEPVTGEVTFGGVDGGLIPPIGKDNIVVRGLRSGGGETANQAAVPLAIKELKTSLPFIDKVFNLQAAVGGADPWSLDNIFELGPQALKNRGRAVTTEDYVWITISNFSEVARARCLAIRAPSPDGSLIVKPGAVSVIIVPKGSDSAPQPTKGLLRRIEAFLRRNALGVIADEIHALPPGYQPIAIAAKVHPEKPEEASLIERRVIQALEAFFHPLTGGEQGQGWPFGRSVYISEVFAVIERTDGVDHVVDAAFVGQPNLPRIDVGENVLVASGAHQIAIV